MAWFAMDYLPWPGGSSHTLPGPCERWSKPFSLGLIILLCVRVGFRSAYATNVFAYVVMLFLLGLTRFLRGGFVTGVLAPEQ